MTNYIGKAMLLKLGTYAAGTTIADCKTHDFKWKVDGVEVTNKSSNSFRTLLEGAGVKSATVDLAGFVTNDAGFETFQGYAQAGSINAMGLGYGDSDTIDGSWLITGFGITGGHDGAQEFTATLESSGALTFTNA